MLSVAEARARILATLTPTGVEVVGLAAAWNRVAARPVVARRRQPPTDQSAMDGYALRAADGAVGNTLRVVGSAPAGHPWAGHLGAGETVRLFTGSVMPDGADTVLLQEDASVEGSLVRPTEAATTPGRHVRRAGQDFDEGDVLVTPGRRLSARDVGLAAAGNHAWVTVHRRPIVAILSTGDEIAMPGEPIPPGGIVSSNSHALAALVQAAGGEPVTLPVVPDDASRIGAAVADLRADLLLTSGGASVGAHDLVRPALEAQGLTLDFWKIAMRPGKPLMFGRLGATPVLGLPGNPVSALVTAILFAWPALQRLGGAAAEGLAPEPARLGRDLPANDHREDFLRAGLAESADGLVATPVERQDSGQFRLLAAADALVVRPPHAAAARAGEAVPILRLRRFGL